MNGPDATVSSSSRAAPFPSQPGDAEHGDPDLRGPGPRELGPEAAIGSGVFDRSGRPIDLARYVELYADPGYRVVARDQVGDRQVVTAWLGIDHGPVADSAEPLIFGTVALEADGQLWQGRELLAGTETDARRNHDLLRRELARLND